MTLIGVLAAFRPRGVFILPCCPADLEPFFELSISTTEWTSNQSSFGLPHTAPYPTPFSLTRTTDLSVPMLLFEIPCGFTSIFRRV